MTTAPYRAFLSSPVDVQPERDAAKRIIEKINLDRPDRRQIKIIRWEDIYYTADGTFQDKLPRPSECDLVVCIFWARAGSELPDAYARADGSLPTGTEFEYEDAISRAVASEPRIPDVLVYRKFAEQLVPLSASQAGLEQKKRLDLYWNRWFHNERGHYTTAFNSFNDLDDFEQQFESHLRQWLSRQEEPVVWTAGSPFRGLEPFDVVHAPIFFGRSRDVDRARARLIQIAQAGPTFLLITGPSGSGKSSLIRAGLVPRLCQSGGLGGGGSCRYCLLTPGAVSGDWAAGLAAALFDDAALKHELAPGDFASPAALAAYLRHMRGELVAVPLLQALRRAGEEQARVQGRTAPAATVLILVVDQLEEIFGWGREDAAQFLAVLRQLAGSKMLVANSIGSVAIWVVATMRSDFQHRLVDYDDLLFLSGRADIRAPEEAERTLELTMPSAASLSDIIRMPAAAAGLTFEAGQNGEPGLVDMIEAEAQPDAMPAVELLLDQLYEKRAGRELTFASYRELGGVAGVMAALGEGAMASVDGAEAAFPRVVRALVARTTRGAPTTSRRVPESFFADDKRAAGLVQALRRRRLVISDHGELRFAHEQLLTGWDRLRRQVASDAQLLEARERVHEAYALWDGAAHESGRLLDGFRLAEARELLAKWGAEALSDRERGLPAFIAASIRKERFRSGVRTATVVAASLAIAGLVGVVLMKLDEAERHRNELAAQRTDIEAAQLMADARVELQIGNSGAAAGKALAAFKKRRNLASRSALWEATNAVSPFFEASLDLTPFGQATALAWLGGDRLAMASEAGLVQVFSASLGMRPVPLAPAWKPARAAFDAETAATIIGMRQAASGVVVVVHNNGSISGFRPDGRSLEAWQPRAVQSALWGTRPPSISPDGRLVVLTTPERTLAFRCEEPTEASKAMACAVLFEHRSAMPSAALDPKGAEIAVTGPGRSVRTYALGRGASGATVEDNYDRADYSALAYAGIAGEFVAILPGSGLVMARLGENSAPPTSHIPRLTDGQTGIGRFGAVEAYAHDCEDDRQFCVSKAFSMTDDGSSPRYLAEWYRLRGHRAGINLQAVDDTGTRLATRDQANHLIIWSSRPDSDAHAPVNLPNIGTWKAQALDAGEGRLAVFDGMGRFSPPAPIADLLEGRAVWKSFPADATAAVRAGNATIAATDDGRLIVAPDGGGEIKVSALPGQVVLERLAWSGKGRLFAAMTKDGRIGWVDADQPERDEIPWFDPLPDGRLPKGMAVDGRRGQLLVTDDHGEVQAFELATGKLLRALANPLLKPAQRGGGASSLAVSPDGRWLAATTFGTELFVYDLASRAGAYRLEGAEAQGQGVAFAPDGQRLASLDQRGRLVIWDMTGAAPERWAVLPHIPQGLYPREESNSAGGQPSLAWPAADRLIVSGRKNALFALDLDVGRWIRRIERLGFRNSP